MPPARLRHRSDTRELLARVRRSILCTPGQATPRQLSCSSTTNQRCHTVLLSLSHVCMPRAVPVKLF